MQCQSERSHCLAVENDDGNISYDFSKRKKEKRFMLCDITIVAICSMRETTITHVNEQIIRIFLPFLVCVWSDYRSLVENRALSIQLQYKLANSSSYCKVSPRAMVNSIYLSFLLK